MKKQVLILDLDGSGLSLGFWSGRFENGGGGADGEDGIAEANARSCNFPRRSNATIKVLSTYDLDEVWKEILHGEYHAIVVVDLPANGNEPENEVPGPLGGVLRLFVELGGAVAFCGPEGSRYIEHMNNIYEGSEIANWRATSYYRSLWGACDDDNVEEFFGPNAHEMRFSVKAASIQGVQPTDRCFGLVPRDPENNIWRRERIRPDDPDEDYDCCVAVHQLWPGTVGYFGDHNLEDVTINLIADFVKNVWGDAVKIAVNAEEKVYQAALELKESGNKHFVAKRYEKAIEKYDRALYKLGRALDRPPKCVTEAQMALQRKVDETIARIKRESSAEWDEDEEEEKNAFADYYMMDMEERLVVHNVFSTHDNPVKLSTNAQAFSGVQRDEIVKILSNKSECLLRLKMYEEASWFAGQALALDPKHEKSLIRNAKACLNADNRKGMFVVQAYFDLRRAVAVNGNGAEEARRMLAEVTAILDERQARFGGIEITDHF